MDKQEKSADSFEEWAYIHYAPKIAKFIIRKHQEKCNPHATGGEGHGYINATIHILYVAGMQRR